MNSEVQFIPETKSDSSDFFKNVLIIILIVIIIFSLLGINIFIIIGNSIQSFIDTFSPFFSKGLADLGYASGTIIGKSSDIVADTSKTGIDILNGTFHSIGDLLIESSGENDSINQPITKMPPEPNPSSSSNPIVSNPSSNKTQWCLVGEYNGKRGCISITDQDKCISGQVFPEQKMCLNPNLTPNA